MLTLLFMGLIQNTSGARNEDEMAKTQTDPTEDEVIGYFDSFSNWGRWGENDTLGALNLITPEKLVGAASLVREGTTLSLARSVAFAPIPDQGEALLPPIHFMQLAGESVSPEGSGSAVDWAGLPLHGLYITHLDAHSHIFWKAKMYNGQPASAVVTDRGATAGGIDNVRNGIVTRGVLLDIPRVRGGEPLHGSESVNLEDVEEAEKSQGVRVEPGDVVLVRTGYGSTRTSRKRGETDSQQPGVGTSCLPWIFDRSPAVLGTDSATDPTGSHTARLRAPVHSVCMVAMGMWIIDGCDLELLAQTCERLQRWEFLFSAAPLRLKNATGSPLNPVAIF
jgi:kynurenine formamidase